MAGLKITNIDDVPWQEVKAQQHGDRRVSIWEKYLEWTPGLMVLYARYDPGMIVRRHGHNSPHVLFVIAGDVTIGERRCPAGTHVELPQGAAFGPIRAGDGGATLFEVMMGDPRSWGDDAAAYQRLLSEHGVEALPDPPLQFPAWLADQRAVWAGADSSATPQQST